MPVSPLTCVLLFLTDKQSEVLPYAMCANIGLTVAPLVRVSMRVGKPSSRLNVIAASSAALSRKWTASWSVDNSNGLRKLWRSSEKPGRNETSWKRNVSSLCEHNRYFFSSKSPLLGDICELFTFVRNHLYTDTVMRKNMNTRVTGTNVVLVPYQKRHVTKYHEWMKCPILRYLTGSEPLTLEEELEMQRHWLEDKDKCTFIILDKHIFDSTGSEVDAMIGDTNLFFNDPQEPHTVEVEIMIADTASRGKKRGWESLILMIQYGVETLGINEFRAKIKLDNALSIKMFEKLGFQEVGRSRVFQEATLEKRVSLDWMGRLSLELQSIASDSSELVAGVVALNH